MSKQFRKGGQSIDHSIVGVAIRIRSFRKRHAGSGIAQILKPRMRNVQDTPRRAMSSLMDMLRTAPPASALSARASCMLCVGHTSGASEDESCRCATFLLEVLRRQGRAKLMNVNNDLRQRDEVDFTMNPRQVPTPVTIPFVTKRPPTLRVEKPLST